MIFINYKLIISARESIYNPTNLLLRMFQVSISYSRRRDIRKSPEAWAGSVSSGGRLVPWMYALLLANAGTVIAPAVSPAHAHEGTHPHVHVAVYTTQEGRSLSSASSARRRAALLCRLTRAFASRDRTLAERTPRGASPCVSSW